MRNDDDERNPLPLEDKLGQRGSIEARAGNLQAEKLVFGSTCNESWISFLGHFQAAPSGK